MAPALAAKLPVTDARRRSDVRMFEEGFSEKAWAPLQWQGASNL